MPSSTKKIIRGGKFLGEGTYGCVFHPTIKKCNILNANTNTNSKQSNYVSKVFTNVTEAHKDFNQGKVMSRIDSNNDYTIVPISMCELTLKELKDVEVEYGKCNKLAEEYMEYSDGIVQVVYSEKGIPLDDYMKQNKLTVSNVLDIAEYLIKGVKFFKDNKVIHHDIKPPNIVMTADNKPKYIDFGLSQEYSTFFEHAFGANYRYWSKEMGLYDAIRGYVYPPDVRDLKYGICEIWKKKYSDTKEVFLENTKKYGTLLSDYGKYLPDLFDEIMGKVYDEKMGCVYDASSNKMVSSDVDKLDKLFEPFLDKFDIFGVGRTIEDMLETVENTPNSTSNSEFSKYEGLIKLVEQTTLSDPRKRMTVEDALSTVQALRGQTAGRTGGRTGGRKKVLLYKNEGKKSCVNIKPKSGKTITKTNTKRKS